MGGLILSCRGEGTVRPERVWISSTAQTTLALWPWRVWHIDSGAGSASLGRLGVLIALKIIITICMQHQALLWQAFTMRAGSPMWLPSDCVCRRSDCVKVLVATRDLDDLLAHLNPLPGIGKSDTTLLL